MYCASTHERLLEVRQLFKTATFWGQVRVTDKREGEAREVMAWSGSSPLWVHPIQQRTSTRATNDTTFWNLLETSVFFNIASVLPASNFLTHNYHLIRRAMKCNNQRWQFCAETFCSISSLSFDWQGGWIERVWHFYFTGGKRVLSELEGSEPESSAGMSALKRKKQYITSTSWSTLHDQKNGLHGSLEISRRPRNALLRLSTPFVI